MSHNSELRQRPQHNTIKARIHIAQHYKTPLTIFNTIDTHSRIILLAQSITRSHSPDEVHRARTFTAAARLNPQSRKQRQHCQASRCPELDISRRPASHCLSTPFRLLLPVPPQEQAPPLLCNHQALISILETLNNTTPKHTPTTTEDLARDLHILSVSTAAVRSHWNRFEQNTTSFLRRRYYTVTYQLLPQGHFKAS